MKRFLNLYSGIGPRLSTNLPAASKNHLKKSRRQQRKTKERAFVVFANKQEFEIQTLGNYLAPHRPPNNLNKPLFITLTSLTSQPP